MRTVLSFGLILIIMGVAQCKQEQYGFRLAYIIMFIVLLVYQAPFFAVATSLQKVVERLF